MSSERANGDYKELSKITKSMPKVELHAHLNGSITREMLLELKSHFKVTSSMASNNNTRIPPSTLETCDNGNHSQQDNNFEAAHEKDSSESTDPAVSQIEKSSLAQCWAAFAKIHESIQTPEILYWVTCQVIKEFYQDQVIYLELRTTPKKIHDIYSKDIYIQNVVNSILDSRKKYSIIVKLLISVDRKEGSESGLENVHLAFKYCQLYPDVVLGLDISGDPNFGNFSWICPLLKEARKLGLKISCHLSEVVNVEETQKFLEFRPDRIAHGQFLHPNTHGTQHLWNLAKNSGIPIEACITSNLISGVTPSIEQHYVKFLHEENFPFAICTDDCGVFGTSLSSEYNKFLEIVPLSKKQLKDLCIRSVSYAFACQGEKDVLSQRITQWWEGQGEEQHLKL